MIEKKKDAVKTDTSVEPPHTREVQQPQSQSQPQSESQSQSQPQSESQSQSQLDAAKVATVPQSKNQSSGSGEQRSNASSKAGKVVTVPQSKNQSSGSGEKRIKRKMISIDGKNKTNNPFILVNSEGTSMDKILQLQTESSELSDENSEMPTITARLLMIKDPDLVLDLGAKAEGYCSISEFSKIPEIGESFSVVITNKDKDGSTRVSYRAAEKYTIWQDLLKKADAKEDILVKVSREDEKGFIVHYKEMIELFLPGSHGVRRYQNNLKKNDEIKVSILKLRKGKMTGLVSHRVVLERELELAWENISKEYGVGSVVNAKVVKRTGFGLFLNLDGVEGLLHKNDISYVRQSSEQKSAMAIGEIIEVKILDMKPETRKLSFGKKQLEEDPWIWVKNNLREGSKVRGCIQSFAEYGIFVIVENRVQALVYRTEVTWSVRSKAPSEILKVGEERDFLVKSIDYDARRICLSIRDLEKDQWFDDVKSYSVGTIVKGKIVNLTKSGAYAEIADGLDAFIFYGDYAWQNPDPKMLKIGDEVELKIRKIEREKCKIYGSIREMSASPAEIFYKDCRPNMMMKTTVVSQKSAGIIVSVDDEKGSKNIRGFLNAMEYRSLPDQRAFEPGQKLELCLQGLDKRGIALSFSLQRRRKHKGNFNRDPKVSIDNMSRHSSTTTVREGIQSTYTPFEILSLKSAKPKPKEEPAAAVQSKPTPKPKPKLKEEPAAVVQSEPTPKPKPKLKEEPATAVQSEPALNSPAHSPPDVDATEKREEKAEKPL